jgi:hypothetical protein
MLGWSMRNDGGEVDDIADWMARRNADVATLNDPDTDAAGRDAWNVATRDGTNVAAQTPLDLRSLGAVQLACGPSPAAGGVWQQVRAGARGAQDAIFLGHANEIGAAMGSVPALISGEPVGPRYQALLQQGRDQDHFDEVHYPVARGVGEVAGTIGALVATDGMAAAAAPRFAAGAYSAARAMPAMTRAERASVALGGAGMGVAGQGVADFTAGRTPDWRDYVASGLDGATVTSGAARIRPVLAAASGAGVRSAADAVLHRRAPDIEQMSADMVGAGYLGGAGGVVGERGSNRLDWRVKGKLGERLSDAKSVAQGNPPARWQFRQPLENGQTTVVDSGLTHGPQDFVESKFGPTARLRGPQIAAHQQFPGRYRDDYWMPSHVGKITGSVLAAFGVPMLDQPGVPDPRSPLLR